MRFWKKIGLSGSDDMLSFLIQQAERRLLNGGHAVTPWGNAKKKMGKGARRAICTSCGRVSFVLPYGQHGLRASMARDVPTITGEALSAPCARVV